MTIRMKAFDFETSFAWQIIATFKKANDYRSMIMRCMNYMMHFHTQKHKHKVRTPSAASDYEIYTLYKFHKIHSGKSVRMKFETFHNGIKSVHIAASDYEMHEWLWCILILKQLLCTECSDSDFESDHLRVTTCQAQFYSIIKWVSRITYIITLCCN